jgi:hypothetical protein
MYSRRALYLSLPIAKVRFLIKSLDTRSKFVYYLIRESIYTENCFENSNLKFHLTDFHYHSKRSIYFRANSRDCTISYNAKTRVFIETLYISGTPKIRGPPSKFAPLHLVSYFTSNKDKPVHPRDRTERSRYKFERTARRLL